MVAHDLVAVADRQRACAEVERGYSPHANRSGAQKGAATLRVMLIEDDATYAWLVEEMLVEAFGGDDIDVAKFDSLGEATKETGIVDCALVDLSLPDSSGLGVIDTV